MIILNLLLLLLLSTNCIRETILNTEEDAENLPVATLKCNSLNNCSMQCINKYVNLYEKLKPLKISHKLISKQFEQLNATFQVERIEMDIELSELSTIVRNGAYQTAEDFRKLGESISIIKSNVVLYENNTETIEKVASEVLSVSKSRVVLLYNPLKKKDVCKRVGLFMECTFPFYFYNCSGDIKAQGSLGRSFTERKVYSFFGKAANTTSKNTTLPLMNLRSQVNYGVFQDEMQMEYFHLPDTSEEEYKDYYTGVVKIASNCNKLQIVFFPDNTTKKECAWAETNL